jgi:hypothetical protein
VPNSNAKPAHWLTLKEYMSTGRIAEGSPPGDNWKRFIPPSKHTYILPPSHKYYILVTLLMLNWGVHFQTAMSNDIRMASMLLLHPNIMSYYGVYDDRKGFIYTTKVPKASEPEFGRGEYKPNPSPSYRRNPRSYPRSFHPPTILATARILLQLKQSLVQLVQEFKGTNSSPELSEAAAHVSEFMKKNAKHGVELMDLYNDYTLSMEQILVLKFFAVYSSGSYTARLNDVGFKNRLSRWEVVQRINIAKETWQHVIAILTEKESLCDDTTRIEIVGSIPPKIPWEHAWQMLVDFGWIDRYEDSMDGVRFPPHSGFVSKLIKQCASTCT